MQIVIKCTCFYVNLIGSQINANKKFCLFLLFVCDLFFFALEYVFLANRDVPQIRN